MTSNKPKQLILCFDGTWNTSKGGEEGISTESNVLKLYRSIVAKEIRPLFGQGPTPPHPSEQRAIKWYDKGVGSDWWNKGPGAFGHGLSLNLMEAYTCITQEYEPGCEIYLFGFSRGAYTAQSLVGLLDCVGVVHKEAADNKRLLESYKRLDARLWEALDEKCWYSNEPLWGSGDVLSRAYDCYRRPGTALTPFQTEYCHEVRPAVKVLGVWDTVGSLGIPLSLFPMEIVESLVEILNKDWWGFHSRKLSPIVSNAFHALALDEHRKDYDATLWETKCPDCPDQIVKQVWFAGAHCDVGGGYPDDRLSKITLSWMQQAAWLSGSGLEYHAGAMHQMEDVWLEGKITDSYAEFLGGNYMKLTDGKRHYREIGRYPAIEKIHHSVLARRASDPSYQPKNLKEPLTLEIE